MAAVVAIVVVAVIVVAVVSVITVVVVAIVVAVAVSSCGETKICLRLLSCHNFNCWQINTLKKFLREKRLSEEKDLRIIMKVTIVSFSELFVEFCRIFWLILMAAQLRD